MPTSYFEYELTDLEKSVTNGIRTALGIGGLVSLVVGILILAWPSKTAMVVAGIIAVYAAIAGVVNLAIGIFSRRLGRWPRVGYSLLGLAFLIAAALAFANLGATAAGLAILLGILVGIVWIIEGIVGLTMVGDAPSKMWTILYAIVSIVAGIAVLSWPLWGAAVLWLLLGLSLAILGVVQLVRAFRFGRR